MHVWITYTWSSVLSVDVHEFRFSLILHRKNFCIKNYFSHWNLTSNLMLIIVYSTMFSCLSMPQAIRYWRIWTSLQQGFYTSFFSNAGSISVVLTPALSQYARCKISWFSYYNLMSSYRLTAIQWAAYALLALGCTTAQLNAS